MFVSWFGGFEVSVKTKLVPGAAYWASPHRDATSASHAESEGKSKDSKNSIARKELRDGLCWFCSKKCNFYNFENYDGFCDCSIAALHGCPAVWPMAAVECGLRERTKPAEFHKFQKNYFVQ